jgi:hypothetical protein
MNGETGAAGRSDVERPPRFSVVLPTHNRADVLPFAIRSALWQTIDDFELLVAGDGCTDRSAEVVAAFGDPRIRWLDLPKAPGIGYANRNVALRAARGRHVAYLAHDDLWFPDHLERLGALLDATGADLAYSRGLAVGLDGRVVPYWFNLGVPSHRAGLWRGESAITLCTVVHTRDCLTRYGYWDETLHRSADIAMWHRIAAGGRFRNVAFQPDPTTLHFVAGWRNTGAHRTRARLASRLIDDALDDLVGASALRLPIRAGESQQESAWNHLHADPVAATRAIREAVVQLQDAVLWKARSPAGLLGLRTGLRLGGMLDRLLRSVMWLASGERRGLFRRLRELTRGVEETLR